MSDSIVDRRWLIAGSYLLGLALTSFPLSGWLALARPDWLALIVIFWAIFATRLQALWMIFLVGLCLDVLFGMLLGQHALALIVTAYVPMRLRLQLRVMSWVQLAAIASALILLYEFVLFWVNGVAGAHSDIRAHAMGWLGSTIAWPLVLFALDALSAATRKASR